MDERIKQDGVFQPSAMATLTILTVVGAEPDVDGWREKKEEKWCGRLCGGFRLACGLHPATQKCGRRRPSTTTKKVPA